MAQAMRLGKTVDGGAGAPLLLKSDDLTTHGLIVGMTGSGKTALGIVMIEELLLQGVPVLAIDPKGDLGNLLLDFPSLAPSDFAPWIEPGTSATPEGEAKKWTEGLAGSGLSASDVAALAAARRAVIYTPGSTSGAGLDLLGTCVRPASGDAEDEGDVAAAFVAGLLGLVGIDADPLRSKESILLDLLVRALWEKDGVATLEELVSAVDRPPFGTVGALPLETFYPQKERQKLVLALNGLLASPSMSAFRKGAPLDLDAMLGGGAPAALSIVSIAHLGDAERLFVVATLLSRVKSWMRGRPGRSTLGALVYIDEIFGFFPPSAEPPTKKPLLQLLKQARAFGIGVVLATQNPVDLDYKGLANCGCWFVGTLQTARDRERLEAGLVQAGGRDLSGLLDRTKKRVFLLHDVHRPEPVLFETRWAMSYLRGPMTREEIAKANTLAGARPAAAPAAPEAGRAAADAAPAVPSPWPARWVEKRGADIASPHLFVRYAVRYRVGKTTAPETEGVRLVPIDAASPGEVMENEAIEIAPSALLAAAPRPMRYAPLPDWLGPRAITAVEKSVRDRLPDKLAVTLLQDPVTGAVSAPGETPEAFAQRVSDASAPAVLRDRLEKKRRDLAAAEQAEKGREFEKYASGAAAAIDLIGGLLGKRKSLRVSKVGSVLSKQRMESAAESRVAALRAEIEELEAKVAPPDASRFTEVHVVPLKAHVDVLAIGVAWVV